GQEHSVEAGRRRPRRPGLPEGPEPHRRRGELLSLTGANVLELEVGEVAEWPGVGDALAPPQPPQDVDVVGQPGVAGHLEPGAGVRASVSYRPGRPSGTTRPPMR